MLSNFKNLLGLTRQLVKISETRSNLFHEKLKSSVMCNVCCAMQKLSFHTDTPRMKYRETVDIRRAVKDAQKKDEGTAGAVAPEIDRALKRSIFPTHDLPYRLFDGIQYKDLPIVFISCSRNNTLMCLSVEGFNKVNRSCGMDGFKNARKGTNIAAQTTGIALALRAARKGFKNVRVVLKGLGPGRLSALKGLELGGMNIISVTDATKVATTQRPRKQRKL